MCATSLICLTYETPARVRRHDVTDSTGKHTQRQDENIQSIHLLYLFNNAFVLSRNHLALIPKT